MSTYALGVAYLGGGYRGWQRQPSGQAIANAVERSLSQVLNMPIEVQCAGRTDAGVHALEQVIHFTVDASNDRGCEAYLRGGNALLPKDIRLLWVRQVPDDFHARFSARARHYRYWMYQGSVLPPHLLGRILHQPQAFSIRAMEEAISRMHGEQDYSLFRSSECQASHAIRHIYHCALTKHDAHFYHIDIIANAFLHHMVRFMVGTLLSVGQGLVKGQALDFSQSKKPAWVKCVRPDGLYFVRAIYPPSLQAHLGHFALYDPILTTPILTDGLLHSCPEWEDMLE